MAVKIPLPPLPEQRRIAQLLDRVSGWLAEVRSLRSAVMQEVHALRRSIIDRIDSDLRAQYGSTTLESFGVRGRAGFRSGPFGSELLHSEFVPSGVPAVGIPDVQENTFILNGRWYVTEKKALELKRFTVFPNDVLVTVMGTLGRTCVVPADAPRMVSTKHVWTMTPDPTLADPRWLSFWLNYSSLTRASLLREKTGTAISGLNGAKLKASSLPAAPVNRQREIVRWLSDLDQKVISAAALTADMSDIDMLEHVLVSRAFSGEI